MSVVEAKRIPAESFYVTGGTLECDARSYVERRADGELYDSLREGQFCYVLTSRQMGKSSLMVRTAGLLREAGVHVAVLDLTALGQNLTAEQWYKGLLGIVGQQLSLEDELDEWWRSRKDVGPMQRWMGAVREVVLEHCRGQVVVFVDEIDVVRSLPFSTDEFFAGIRECYNRRAEDAALACLTFCLLGVASPSDLIRDTRVTPFNIGVRVELDDFTRSEAGVLADGFRREPAVETALLERVYHWTGGHPYLTQRLCQAIAADPGAKAATDVERRCEELFLSSRARERDDNLLFVRERLLRSEADLASVLELYRKVRAGKRVADDETNPLVDLLRLSGVTRVDDGRLRVRNRIYERVFDRAWVTSHMPDAEVRRQRAAYRRGLLRAAAIAAVVIAVMAVLVFVAVDRTRRAEEQRTLAQQQEYRNRQLLYAAQMNVAFQAWDAGHIGSALDLLEAQRPASGQQDLRGFEWYYLWRVCHDTGEIRTFRGHSDRVGEVAFSGDGTRLTTASSDNTVKVWETATGRELASFPARPWNKTFSYSPDGSVLAVCDPGGAAKLWAPETGRELAAFSTKAAVRSVAFSPDGKLLATGLADGTAKLWDVAGGRELATFDAHTISTVYRVGFSPDGQRLSAEYGEEMTVWNVTTGRKEPVVDIAPGRDRIVRLIAQARKSWPRGTAWSPDGTKVAIGWDDGTVRLYDATTQKELAVFKGHTSAITCVAFSPDGRTLVSSSLDATARLWDATASWEPVTLSAPMEPILADPTWRMAISADGRLLAVPRAGELLNPEKRESTVAVVDMVTRQTVAIFEDPQANVLNAAFSLDGTKLATWGWNVAVWDVATRQRLATIPERAAGIWVAAFSPDGRSLVTGGAGGVSVWDAISGQELMRLRGHEGPVFGVAFSPDGTMLATSGRDGTVRLWDAATGRELVTLGSHAQAVTGLAFSPDGTILASGSKEGTIKLWDTAARRELATFQLGTGFFSLAFSPDGRTLAVSCSEGVRLYCVIARQELGTIGPRSVTCIRFPPDGRSLVIENSGAEVSLLRAASDEELAAEAARRGQAQPGGGG